MVVEDYNVTEVFMPTYLQDIFRNTNIITLIHNNLNTNLINSTSSLIEHIPTNTPERKHDGEEEVLDLTGNPLEVDLKDDGDIEISLKAQKPNNWTVAEGLHYALDIKYARQILNKLTEKVWKQMVCICNGKDAKKTLTVGIKNENFERMVVNYIGHFALNQPEASFSTMLNAHMKNGGSGAGVNVNVATLYSILGLNKRRAQDIQNTNVGNSAFVEATWCDQTYEMSNDRKVTLVNAANSDSMFHSLWQQITMIESFIEQLQDDDDLDKMTIATDPVPYYTIAESITEKLSKYETRSYIQKSEVINWQDLKVLHMRPEDFLEVLWNLLIRLDNLQSVLQCFNTLFQDFTDDSIRYTVPTSNHTTIGQIIKGLIEGTVAVPTLTLQATLKFLIELGLNKIRNDYMFLIKNMDENRDAHFDELWTKIVQDSGNAEISKKTAARKSRVTLMKGNENYGLLIRQLNHITHLHLSAEFMFLVRSCQLGADATSHIHERICKNASIAKSFKTLKNECIVDFDCALITVHSDIVKKLSPVSINVNFHSEKCDSTAVTTIFQYSDSPIYPDTVFNDYEFDVKKINGKCYFAHQASIFSG